MDNASQSNVNTRLQSLLYSLTPPSQLPVHMTQLEPPNISDHQQQPLYSADDIPDHPQCEPRHLRIVHVGGGASGLIFSHKTQRLLKNYELICYEKNDSIGGTWLENRYPGCACDIPAHSYVFTFEPNPDWSGYYSYAGEIQAYLQNFAKKYDVEKYIKLNTEVLNAAWDMTLNKWVVQLKDRKTNKIYTDTCDVLVNGHGVLNKWKWPAIDGLHDFKGALVHSANWDQSLDWKNKRVAIIGNGSSAVQIVPSIAETASHLTVFMRNPTYIGPPVGSHIKNTKADPEAMDPGAAGKHTYTEKEKQVFRDDPEYFLEYRTTLEQAVIGFFPMFLRGTETNKTVKSMMQESMRKRLGHKEDIKSWLIPDWSPGCRRITPGEGYLEALTRDNVSTVRDRITKITSKGLLTEDGAEHEVDILICATGFNVAFVPHFKITGVDGKIMQDHPEPGGNVYASIAVPGFPNYFVIAGPRGNWGQGCILPSHETQSEYISQCCKKMQEDGIAYMMPKQKHTAQLNQYFDAWHKKHSVWAEECRSWYKGNTTDGRIHLWAGSFLHLLKFLKRPRYEHYDIVYQDEDNIFAFLGNGITISEQKYGMKVPVPYIRNNEDEEWDIE